MGGKSRNSDRLYIPGLQKSLQTVTAAMKLKGTCSLEEIYDKPRQCIKKQRHNFANKGPYNQSYGFTSSVQLLSHVWLFATPWTTAH